jgi:hypothetical protein
MLRAPLRSLIAPIINVIIHLTIEFNCQFGAKKMCFLEAHLGA